jgi:hypothetical protein
VAGVGPVVFVIVEKDFFMALYVGCRFDGDGAVTLDKEAGVCRVGVERVIDVGSEAGWFLGDGVDGVDGNVGLVIMECVEGVEVRVPDLGDGDRGAAMIVADDCARFDGDFGKSAFACTGQGAEAEANVFLGFFVIGEFGVGEAAFGGRGSSSA